MGLFTRLILNALALLLVAWMFDGIRFAAGLGGVIAALWAAVVLGLVNATIKPIFHLFALPISIVTLGIFALIINAVLLKLVAVLTPGFEVNGFFAAFFGAIVLAIISSILNSISD